MDTVFLFGKQYGFQESGQIPHTNVHTTPSPGHHPPLKISLLWCVDLIMEPDLSFPASVSYEIIEQNEQFYFLQGEAGFK